MTPRPARAVPPSSAVVLDASGSMGSLRTTTIESLKKFFAGLKSDEDKTLLDVWQFDDEVKHLADSVDASNVESPQVLRNGCLIRTRTLTSRFRICGATITP